MVFGKVTKGMTLVKEIESFGTPKSGIPLALIVISDCGMVKTDTNFKKEIKKPMHKNYSLD